MLQEEGIQNSFETSSNPVFCSLFRREACNEGEGDPPLYVNVNMMSGEIMNTWIDSLQAFFPGLQVRLYVLKAVQDLIWKCKCAVVLHGYTLLWCFRC